MQGPHRRLRTIDIAGGGAPERHKTAGEVQVERDGGNAMAIGPCWMMGGGIPPPVGCRWTISRRQCVSSCGIL